MRVLLIEDDSMIGAALEQALKDAAYAVDWVTDGEAAVHAVKSETYELVLLDLGLPKADGRDVLLRLRTLGGKLPVIIVTARDSVEDRIGGLDLGADDYLTKPFEIRELLARMRAVLRREASGSAPLLSNGMLNLDPATREAFFLGKRVRLSAREFALLHALLARPGTILSRSELERQIYGWNEEVESNAIEFLIHSSAKSSDPARSAMCEASDGWWSAAHDQILARTIVRRIDRRDRPGRHDRRDFYVQMGVR